jgi:hypothetical protein
MWLNIKWYDANGNPLLDANGDPIEYGKYGFIIVQWDVNGDLIVDENDKVKTIIDPYDPNTKIYEAHYGMTQEWAEELSALHDPSLVLSYDRYDPDNLDKQFTLADLVAQAPGTYHETFHFVLNNKVVKDNRIPPYGMSYDKALQRNALPVPETQYGGGPGKTYDYFDTFHLKPADQLRIPVISIEEQSQAKCLPGTGRRLYVRGLAQYRHGRPLCDGVNHLARSDYTAMQCDSSNAAFCNSKLSTGDCRVGSSQLSRRCHRWLQTILRSGR